jgi:adenylate kinase family enzyme
MPKKYILVTGAMRAGKDTFANFLVERWPGTFAKISLADELKENELELRKIYLDLVLEALRKNGVYVPTAQVAEYVMAQKNRAACQKLGTEWGRRANPLVWVEALVRRAQKVDAPYAIVPDCRFDNEFYSNKLLPGHRIIVYADDETITKRLRESNDPSKPWGHDSERLAHYLYGVYKENDKSPILDGAPVFDTSYLTGLSMAEYKASALSWARTMLSEDGHVATA